jgi:formylglycine-generating enzyme required for sulfatase activity
MHGNVWEWVEDQWHSARADGWAWVDKLRGSDRGVRGGGWGDSDRGCQSTTRGASGSDRGSDRLGFRLAMSPPNTP